MVKNDLRKKLKAAAKRRDRRVVSAAPPQPGAAKNATTAHGTSAKRDAESDVIAAVLTLADTQRLVNHSILRACRSFLQFSSTQDQVAATLSGHFQRLRDSAGHGERPLRDAVNQVMQQAALHCRDDDADDNSLVAFLRTLNS